MYNWCCVLLLEKIFQFGECGVSIFHLYLALSRNKVAAEVGLHFLGLPHRRGLPALVVDVRIKEPAILAGSQIDAAMHAGVDHYTMMKGIIQGIVNLFTIGLFHLFEQQLLYFHRTELLMRHEEDNPDLLKLDKAKEILLRDYKIDIERFSAWGKVNELRLVANTVKHADGTSAEKLKTLRPELFRHPEFDRDSRRSGLAITPGQVFQPMAGQDVYITVDEFNLYVEAVKHFWFELSSAFEGI